MRSIKNTPTDDAAETSRQDPLLSKGVGPDALERCWNWKRAGKFPRSREVGDRAMWLASEIDAWIHALPVRRLKGDAGQGRKR
jgi:hypothetical protein